MLDNSSSRCLAYADGGRRINANSETALFSKISNKTLHGQSFGRSFHKSGELGLGA